MLFGMAFWIDGTWVRLNLWKELTVIKVMWAWTEFFRCEDEHKEIILEIYQNLSDYFCMVSAWGSGGKSELKMKCYDLSGRQNVIFICIDRGERLESWGWADLRHPQRSVGNRLGF